MSEDYTATIIFTKGVTDVVTALTSLDGLAGWWTEVAGDGRSGGELNFFFGDLEPLRMRVDAVRPDGVQWTCLGYATVPDWTGTIVHFELAERAGGGSELSFRHEGLTPKLDCFEDCRNGWTYFLSSLQALVDSGAGFPRGSDADIARRAARDAAKVAAS